MNHKIEKLGDIYAAIENEGLVHAVQHYYGKIECNDKVLEEKWNHLADALEDLQDYLGIDA